MPKTREFAVAVEDMDTGETIAEIGILATVVPDSRFIAGKWGTLDQWQCAACAWDTLEGLATFDLHWASAHALPVPVIYGPDGQPIQSGG